MTGEEILALVGGAVFVLFGVLMTLMRDDSERLKQEGVRTEGVVVDNDGWWMSIEYGDSAGNPIRVKMGTVKMGNPSSDLSTGSTVPLYYDPNKPRHSAIDPEVLANQPRLDKYRRYSGRATGILFIGVGIALMIVTF